MKIVFFLVLLGGLWRGCEGAEQGEEEGDFWVSSGGNWRNNWRDNYTAFYNATVDELSDDSVVDEEQCRGGQEGGCTLRNAVHFCLSVLKNSTDHCTVFLPDYAELTLKSPGIVVNDTVGNLTIMGRGAIVQKGLSVTDHGLFRVDGGNIVNKFHFNMHNMTIVGFGHIDDFGGAVWLGNSGMSNFEHLIFRNNKGRDGGALDIQNTDNVNIFHCEFYNNNCMGNGGALGIGEFNQHTVIRDCIFADNSAVELSHPGGGFGAGGGVAVDRRNSNLTFAYNILTNNSAPAGGGMSLAEFNVGVEFIGNKFLRNFALVDGAGLYSHNTNRLLTFEGDVFDSNVCFYRGGVIYFYRNMNRIVFSKVIFQGNRARNGGGFFGYYDNTAMDFYETSFINNTCDDSGGAFNLFQNNLRLTLHDCYFEGNVANFQGGAIDCRTNDWFGITGSTFVNNRCGRFDGGAVNVGIDNGTPVISHSTFIGNRAANDGGGLFFGANNYQLTLINNTFIGNIAENYGGGVAIRSNNMNGKFTDLKFISNMALVAGGAMHSALRTSNFLMVDFYLEANSATSYAGGIFFGNDHRNVTLRQGYIERSVARYGAGIYISQFNTNFILEFLKFQSNRAIIYGGAMTVYANMLSLESSEFMDNTAEEDVGALFVGEASAGASYSTLILNCTFLKNIGNGNHGALLIEDRRGVTISKCSFKENDARRGLGGAISIYTSQFIFVEYTTIEHNLCLLGGGGMNVFAVTNFTVYKSEINSNRALAGTGGAIRTQMTAACVLRELTINNNFAQIEGGGLHLSGVQLEEREIASDITIEGSIINGNIASEGSGSAIWVAQCYLELNRNSFSWNRAPNGGGTLLWSYSSGMAEPTSSGNTWSDTNYGYYGSKWATEGCQFQVDRNGSLISVNNSLNVTVYDDVIPYFMVSVVDFYGQLISNNNQTMVDISVTSNTICTDYLRKHNISAYVAGSISERVNEGTANFSALTAHCAPGDAMSVVLSVDALPAGDVNYHSNFEGVVSFAFRECVRGEVLETGFCQACSEGFYTFDGSACRECPDNAYCPGGAVIEVDSGYWRQCEDCHDVVSCMNTDACEGGATVADQCQKGHEGPLCNVCMEDYAFGADDMTCTACDSDTRNNTMTIVVVLLTFVSVVSIFVYVKRDWLWKQYEIMTEKIEDLAEKYKIESFMTKLKICFAFFQILGGLPTITNVPYPKSFQSVMDVMAFTNVNIFSLFSVGCVTEYNFYDSLLVYTLGPFFLILAILVLVSVRVQISKRLNPHNPSYTYKDKNNDRKRLIIIVGFIFFSPASVKLFQTFVCDEFEDGSRTLVADSSVDCDTDTHIAYTVYATCMLFIYPIGIPLYYFRNLYRVRRLVNPPTTAVVTEDEAVLISHKVIRKGKIKIRESTENIQKISFLYDSYIPEMWFFEVVECFRRLFLTAVPILFLRSSVMQVILILLISLGCSALYMQVQPFAKESDNSVAKCSQWAISLTVLGSLCLKVDLSDEVSYAEEMIGIIMIIINIFVVLLTLRASVIPNESDAKDEIAFQEFSQTLNQEILKQEEARDRRSKIGAMGLEKAERITAWELRQTEGSTSRRSLADLREGFDSDDEDSDENNESDSDEENDSNNTVNGSEVNRTSSSYAVEMTNVRNPMR